MIATILSIVALALLGMFAFVLVIGVGIFAVRKLRSESLVPKSTKRAIGEKLEHVHRERRVREAVEDLVAAEGYELSK